MTYTNTIPTMNYCINKQVMCEFANELGYCKLTACAKPLSFPTTYTNNKTNYKDGNSKMTKKKAKIRLQMLLANRCDTCRYGDGKCTQDCEFREAVNMAIKSLCNDLISRTDAIKAIESRQTEQWIDADVDYNNGLESAVAEIKALPSA